MIVDRSIFRANILEYGTSFAPVVVAIVTAATDEGNVGNNKHATPKILANNDNRHCIICVPPCVFKK